MFTPIFNAASEKVCLPEIHSAVFMYDHTNINQSLQAAGAFVTLLSNMFHKMSELEYIGMVRENIIVGDESHETIEAQKKRSWSFIG